MKKAIANGIPFTRFLAGPRTYLKALYESDEFKEYYNSNPVEIVHGPMLGSITSRSARVWLRTFHESEVQIVVYEKQNPAKKYIGENNTDKGKDYTTAVDIAGLTSNTNYYYDVIINGKPVLNGRYPEFSTYPEKGAPGKYTIAFGGGAGFTPRHEYIWSNINRHNLDALLLLGDNVYIDMPGMPNEFHNFTYYRRQSNPYFRSLINNTPVYAIWDDHDAAMDDVWLGPFTDKPEWKIANFQVFRNNWVNPYYGSEDRPACYFDFSIGDVEFFMLDGRSYRTCPFDTSYRTMLGPEQKQWLKEKLAASKGTVKVIVSPVPWSFKAKPGSHDTWAGFPEEREEIFKYIEELKLDGVILMSADRHRSDAWEIERTNGYNLFEFQSSRLTNMHTHELMPGAIIAYNEKCSFGKLEFDTDSSEPKITFSIMNIDNLLVDSMSIYLKDIYYPDKK
jgi:alkaline phosphatase D